MKPRVGILKAHELYEVDASPNAYTRPGDDACMIANAILALDCTMRRIAEALEAVAPEPPAPPEGT